MFKKWCFDHKTIILTTRTSNFADQISFCFVVLHKLQAYACAQSCDVQSISVFQMAWMFDGCKSGLFSVLLKSLDWFFPRLEATEGMEMCRMSTPKQKYRLHRLMERNPRTLSEVIVSDVVETETETWLKFRDETETSSKTPRLETWSSKPRLET